MAEIANHAGNEPWPSLDWASWIFDRASFVLIGSLIVGAAATVAMVWMGIVKEHHWDLLRESAAERIASVQLEAANANERAAELKLGLEKEISKRRGRSLTKQQFDAIQELKGKMDRVSLTFQEGSLESMSFAFSLIDALRAAGIHVQSFISPLGTAWTEVVLYLPSKGKLNDEFLATQPIVSAFARANLGGSYADIRFAPVRSEARNPELPLDIPLIAVGEKAIEPSPGYNPILDKK